MKRIFALGSIFLILVGWEPIAFGTVQELKVSESELKLPEMPKPPQDDGESSKAAAAAAAASAGAAQSNMNCMLLMNEARKAPDKETRTMMMMMAMQQCQQASAMQMSAIENKRNARAAGSSKELPKPGSFTAGKTELKATESKEETISFDENAPARSLLDAGEIPVDAPIVPELTKKKTEAPSETQVAAGPQLPPTALAPIKPGNIEFEDSTKLAAAGGFGAPTAALALGPSGSTAGTNPLSAAVTKDGQGVNSTATPAASGERGRSVASEPGPSPVGSASAEESSSGESALDALMSQLNGGDAAEMDVPQLGEGQVLTTETGADSERINIFEFASTRFQKLTDARRLTVVANTSK